MSAHEAVPRPGTAYSAEGMNTGLPADLGNPLHFPATAHCTGCTEIIRREKYMVPGSPEEDAWHHTGRKAGEPEPIS